MFWLHTISSIIASILILWLAVACKIKRMKGHLIISIIMTIAGITSLVSSILYGFIMDFSLNWPNIHYWTGFASLILSLIPMIALITKDDRWHPKVGYAAGLMAFIALITGFIAFGGLMFNNSISDECIELIELNDSSQCLVAVDGLVYDMTNMPRWGSGTHYDYGCGGNYSKDYLVEQTWQPHDLTIREFLLWIFYRTADQLPEESRTILWVREDIFRLVPVGGEMVISAPQ